MRLHPEHRMNSEATHPDQISIDQFRMPCTGHLGFEDKMALGGTSPTQVTAKTRNYMVLSEQVASREVNLSQ